MSSRSPDRRLAALMGSMALIGLAACGAPAQDEPEATAPAQSAEMDEAALIENGREIVEMQCAFCHAVRPGTASPRADAPSLTMVLEDYDPDALADDFREGIHVGHPDMPDFNLGPIGTDSVLAYLVSIREPGNPAP